MTKPINAVLFDLDGTLVDTAVDFVRIIKKLCAQDGVPCPAEDDIREQVSAGSRAMVGLISDALCKAGDVAYSAEQVEAYRQRFLDNYSNNICVHSCLYAGFETVLEKLEQSGTLWGIVTNKPRSLSELLLEELKLTQRCAVLVCPDDVVNSKPDPEPMHLAAKQLGVDGRGVVYVGDHPRDIEAGNAAGMTTVVAKYGYLPADDGKHSKHKHNVPSWGADFCIDAPKDLIDLFWHGGAFTMPLGNYRLDWKQ